MTVTPATIDDLRSQIDAAEARIRAMRVILKDHVDLVRRLEGQTVAHQIPEATPEEVAALADCIGDLEADALLLSLLSRIAPAVAKAKHEFLRGAVDRSERQR